MTYLIACILLICAALLAALPLRTTRSRIVGASAYALLAAATSLGYADTLSRPKPLKLEFAHWDADRAEVLAYQLVEGEAIYLWLRLPGLMQPRYYALPWDMRTANELMAAQQNAGPGGSYGLNLPFQRSWDRQPPKFYELPQPKLPDKMGEPPVEHPEEGA
jgi:hypothetical protein